MGQAKDVAAHERALKAVQMCVEGNTYEQIAETLEYSGRASAHNAINAVLKRCEAEYVSTPRAVSGARYETIIANMMPVLTETTYEGPSELTIPLHPVVDRVSAAKTVMRAQDSLNRLFGLNVDPAMTSGNGTQFLIVEAEVLSDNM